MKKAYYLGILVLAIMAVFSCAKKEEQTKTAQTKPPDPVTGIREADFVWGKEVGPNVTFYYQPDDSLARIAGAVKNRVVKVYQTVSDYLGYTQLEPIEFYCYKNMEVLKQYTGRDSAFFIGNRIYYGYGPTYGREFAEFVMGKIPGGPSRFAFVRDGMLMLLDHSGRNYHHASNNFLQQQQLLPVQVLTDDEKYDREEGLQKQVEAASLCAYIMWEYGIEKFLLVYHGQSDFPTTVKQVLGVDLNKLESDWEAFLPEHTNEKEFERGKAAPGGGRS
jgi:hypothetical protein